MSEYNRCFTYPQGERPVLIQILSLMAFVCSINAFPFYFNHNFMCRTTEDNGYTCYTLHLVDTDVWSVEGRQGWASAIRVAGLFGTIAAGIGFVGLCLLMAGVCFAFKARKLLILAIAYAVAALCQILTLFAGVADVCADVEDCENSRARMESGGIFSLCAFFLYLALLVLILLFFREVRNAENGNRSKAAGNQQQVGTPAPAPTHQEILPLTNSASNQNTESQPVMNDLREYVNDDGETVREFTDESGAYVKQISCKTPSETAQEPPHSATTIGLTVLKPPKRGGRDEV